MALIRSEETTELVKIVMENGDEMVAKLYPEIAPITVKNFQKLVGGGFYNGILFHRVIPGFMIQGGCPKGIGTGGPGWSIKGEFAANGIPNNLKHKRGVLSMARASEPDSAGSQFFVMHQAAPHLDGQYAAFGELVEGIEVVDRICQEITDFADKPLNEQRMKEVYFVKEA